MGQMKFNLVLDYLCGLNCTMKISDFLVLFSILLMQEGAIVAGQQNSSLVQSRGAIAVFEVTGVADSGKYFDLGITEATIKAAPGGKFTSGSTAKAQITAANGYKKGCVDIRMWKEGSKGYQGVHGRKDPYSAMKAGDWAVGDKIYLVPCSVDLGDGVFEVTGVADSGKYFDLGVTEADLNAAGVNFASGWTAKVQITAADGSKTGCIVVKMWKEGINKKFQGVNGRKDPGYGEAGDWAVGDKIDLVSCSACPRPPGWCVTGRDTYQETVDCDDDGIPDLTCSNTLGSFGLISRKSNCKSIWPNAKCGKVCHRPNGWCSGAGFFALQDCDRDGILDPTCSGTTGGFGVISSKDNCKSTWPNAKCGSGPGSKAWGKEWLKNGVYRLDLGTFRYANPIGFVGDEGDWGKMEYCGGRKDAGHAVDFKIRVEGKQLLGDDTAMNAMCLKCNDEKWICSKQGDFGDWYHANFDSWKKRYPYRLNRCQNGFNGFMYQYEGAPGAGDDTAANNIALSCSNIMIVGGRSRNEWMISTKSPTLWGGWYPNGNPSLERCPMGLVICGIQTRVQYSGDDTALNGIKFYCCKRRTQTHYHH